MTDAEMRALVAKVNLQCANTRYILRMLAFVSWQVAKIYAGLAVEWFHHWLRPDHHRLQGEP